MAEFRIRQEQAAEFRLDALERFEDNAVRHLRTHLAGPTEGLTDGDLRHRVRDCIARSTGFGLASEQQVMCFVDASFLLASERFEDDPGHVWARIVLESPRLRPGEKASILLATATNVYNQQRHRVELKGETHGG